MGDDAKLVNAYPEGLGLKEHIAHDIRTGRFPARSTIAAFLGERVGDAVAKRPGLSMLGLMEKVDALTAELSNLTAERDAALARVEALEAALRECAAIIPGMAASKMMTAEAAMAAVRRARALLAPSAEEAGDG